MWKRNLRSLWLKATQTKGYTKMSGGELKIKPCRDSEFPCLLLSPQSLLSTVPGTEKVLSKLLLIERIPPSCLYTVMKNWKQRDSRIYMLNQTRQMRV